MTFPKLVVHAALAGLYGGFIVALFLRLANRAVVHEGAGEALTVLVVAAAYTIAAAAIWPALYAALRFFARHRLHLDWLSLRYVNGFSAANTAVVLAAGWAMLSDFRPALAPPDLDRLARACVLLTVAWLFAAGVATVPVLRRRTGLQAAATAVALAALMMSLRGGGVSRPEGMMAAVVPAASSSGTAEPMSPETPAPAGRAPQRAAAQAASPAAPRLLLLLNFDGADLDTILTMRAQGKLPAFARMIEEGTFGRLASIAPCVAAVTRATFITGMLPYRHGVRGGEVRKVLGRGPRIEVVPPGIGFDLLLAPVLQLRRTSVEDRGVPAFWEIGERLGIPGRAAGWDIDLDDPHAPGPGPADTPSGWLSELLDPEILRQKDPRGRALAREIARAAAADASVLEALRLPSRGEERGIVAASFPGLDRLAHVFLRYARPADFGNVSARDIDLYGPVLERYYRTIDGILGSALKTHGERALILVTATHGMEPVPALHRLKDEILAGEHLSGVHDGTPPGFLFARGEDTIRGRVFGKGSLADVTPTILYALGLPVARDVQGSILTGVFSEAYTVSHPVTVIESYGTGR